MSVDVYRGIAVAGMILVDNPGDDERAFAPIKHAQWDGWTPADLIFPSFLFLVGMSIVNAFSARLLRGESRRGIFGHVIQRALILGLLGILVNGFPLYHLQDWRIEGVLQRIAICYVVAAVLELWGNRRIQIAALVVILAEYWALLRLLPMGNLFQDPEGMLSTVPAIGTALAGVLTGHWLCSERSEPQKAWGMFAAGVVGLIVGGIWDHWFPINKHLWTSSFVVFTAGFSLSFLSFLYWVIEIRRWRGAWTMPFLVFDMNAILGFIADALVYGPMYDFTTTGAGGEAINWQQWSQMHLQALVGSAPLASLIHSLAAVLFCWMLLWPLYRKRIFIKL